MGAGRTPEGVGAPTERSKVDGAFREPTLAVRGAVPVSTGAVQLEARVRQPCSPVKTVRELYLPTTSLSSPWLPD